MPEDQTMSIVRKHNSELRHSQYESTAVKYQHQVFVTPFSMSQSTTIEMQHQGYSGSRYRKSVMDSGDTNYGNFLQLTDN